MSNLNQLTVTEQRRALSPGELGDKWGKSRKHIYDLIGRGEIKSFRSGRSRLIPMAEILRVESGDD